MTNLWYNNPCDFLGRRIGKPIAIAPTDVAG